MGDWHGRLAQGNAGRSSLNRRFARAGARIQVLSFLLDQGGATPRICMHLFCLSSCHVVYWATTQPCSPSICRARMDEIWGIEYRSRRLNG